MFVIIRNEIEILKDSSAESDKSFYDFYTANLLMQQLNQNVIPSKHWTIPEIQYPWYNLCKGGISMRNILGVIISILVIVVLLKLLGVL